MHSYFLCVFRRYILVPGLVLDQEKIIEPTPTLVLALWYRSVLGQRPFGHPHPG